MTKTEAAEIIANEVIAFARQNGKTLSKDLVENRIGENRITTKPGTYMNQAAHLANWRTVLRIAQQGWIW